MWIDNLNKKLFSMNILDYIISQNQFLSIHSIVM